MKNQANIQTRKSRRELAHALMDYFVEHPGEDFSKNDLYNEFKLKNHPSRKVLVDILDDLVMCEYLSVGSGGHYRLLQQQGQLKDLYPPHQHQLSI